MVAKYSHILLRNCFEFVSNFWLSINKDDGNLSF